MVNRVTDGEPDVNFVDQTPVSVRESSITRSADSNNNESNSAPANAPAAPGKSKDIFTGLCEALNAFQRRLADPKDPNRKYDIADQYEIEFAPRSLASATLKRQGTTDKSKTPMQQPVAGSISPASNSVNKKGSIKSVVAGTQIVQFIDQIMRESSYITDQQTYIVDPETQKTKPNPSPSNGVTAWYKISVEATQIGFDKRRRDHAYRMKFIIAPYAINSLPSDWFKNSRYRGSHKSYNYWFTGQNKEILNFEQEYNYYYRLIISGFGVPVQQRSLTDFRDVYTKTFLPTSENHAKGADGYVNEAGDNAASYLYSPRDQTEVKLRIVGDPAWMQQGEVSEGINARNFNFSPFANDGTINYDSQEVVFDVKWNQPADYDLNTGLVDLNRTGVKPDGTYSTEPQYNFTYTAITCKSFFKQGKFEQEIQGKLLTEFQRNISPSDTGRTVAQTPGTNNSVRINTNNSATTQQWTEADSPQVSNNDVTADSNTNDEDSDSQLLNSPLPEPPTSDGDIETFDINFSDSVQEGVINNPDEQLTNRET